METSERKTTVVIVAFVVVVCVVLAGLVGALALFRRLAPAALSPELQPEARVEQTFAVGQAPSLDVDNFAGPVAVTAGPAGEMRVTATKKALSARALERITVELREAENGLEVRTERPAGISNAYVELVIVVPADTRVLVHTGSGAVTARGLYRETRIDTGSGSVQVDDLAGLVQVETGSGGVTARKVRGDLEVDSGSGSIEFEQIEGAIEAETGSGSITVRSAAGAIRVHTGSGGIDYEGVPSGECVFDTGSGGIDLRVPADLQMAVDLSTGSGSVETGFAVDGQVERRRVEGVVGRGDQAQIRAHTGSGGVDLTPR